MPSEKCSTFLVLSMVALSIPVDCPIFQVVCSIEATVLVQSLLKNSLVLPAASFSRLLTQLTLSTIGGCLDLANTLNPASLNNEKSVVPVAADVFLALPEASVDTLKKIKIYLTLYC